ncbi:hypothetical protein SAMN06296036_109152 [Pseudobacteriovorax antillogorgiicola]|uniref:Uncharacterized protein n=1 Tax=Pseudobacteriovorax antillogorgiicola TaxID=1513793 RepID=A0A1Y6BV35_9BACT|nr:hypothetical protein EDD56_10961 [Pseudobacteriovorax antillogorgiicola]SMF30142.1 hypothetical protein SAMN06296036_109152 [Pseudobacteriovorax antillogorgiicola]
MNAIENIFSSKIGGLEILRPMAWNLHGLRVNSANFDVMK